MKDFTLVSDTFSRMNISNDKGQLNSANIYNCTPLSKPDNLVLDSEYSQVCKSSLF